jgi:hypothetical protein
MLEGITDTMNQVLSMELSDTIKRNLTTNAQQRDPETGWAYKNGGPALFGYKNVRISRNGNSHRQGHTIWLLNDTITCGKPIHEWMRTILIDWRLKERLGYAKIAQRLTELEIPTTRGNIYWSASTISYLLTWDRLLSYAGYGFWGKDDQYDRQRPPAEWIVIPNAHPAIITEEEAEMTEEIRRPVSSAGKPAQRARAGRWLLTGGLLVCGSCGSNYCGNVSSRQDYYICGAYKYRRGAGCGPFWQIKREYLENAVIDAIAHAFPRKSIKRMAEMTNKQNQEEAKLYRDTEPERSARILELEQEISRLMDMAVRGVNQRAVEIEINKRIAEKARFEALSKYEIPKPVTVEYFEKIVDIIERARDSNDIELRRCVIQEKVHRLEAFPERQEIILTLKGGPGGTSGSSISLPTIGNPLAPPPFGSKIYIIKGKKYGKLKIRAVKSSARKTKV